MRCQSCQDHGFTQHRFCPCCGRPVAEHVNDPAVSDSVARPGPGPDEESDPLPWAQRRCESCGAPWEGAGTLCGTCERVFARVLDAAHPQAGGRRVVAPSPEAAPAATVAATPGVAIAVPPVATEQASQAVAPDVAPAPQATAVASPIDDAPSPFAAAVAEPDVDATVRLPRPGVAAASTEPPPRPWWEVEVVQPPAAAVRQEPDRPPKLTSIVAVPAELRIQTPVASPQAVAQVVTTPPPLPATATGAAPNSLQPAGRRPRVRPSLTRPRVGVRVARAVKVATGVSALAVLLLLGMPTFQAAWQTAAVAPPATGAAPPADTAAPVEVPEATPGAAPAADLAPTVRETPAPVTPQVPVRPEGKRDTSPSKSAKATKLKPPPAKKASVVETALSVPAPVVVPERAVPMPIQPPAHAITPVDAASAPALGPTFEAAQVDVRPRVESQVPASLPERLRNRRLQDVVVLRVRVSSSGRPADVQVLKRSTVDAALDGAAVAAVRQWRFSPARRRGEAVNCWMNVGVPFRVDETEGTR